MITRAQQWRIEVHGAKKTVILEINPKTWLPNSLWAHYKLGDVLGEGVDGVAYDPSLQRIYSSNGEGTLTIIQKNQLQFTVLKNLPSQIGARTICINPETHYLYLPVADYDKAPAPTSENPHPRPSIKPGTFTILEIAP